MTADQQQMWEAICGDATGRLYGVVQGPADQGGCPILVVDVSPDSLANKDAQEASTPLSSLNVQQVVCTTPAIDFTVTAAAVSANGHQMLLVGSSHAEDTDVPVLALVDLYGSTPLSSPAAAAAVAGAATASCLSSQYPTARLRMAGLFHVHRGLYDERPGMKLLQASWHPGSSSHFAVLASDNRWRLYHTARLAEAEQTFWLRLPGAQGSVGLRRRGASSPARLTAFSFGPQNLGWAAFTVLFLASDGGVYAVCPVAPFGMRARGAMLRQLPGVNERGTVHTWLLGAFLEVLSNEAAAAVSAQPHVLETLAPCLQGPLNLDQPSLKPSTGRRVACTMALSGGSGSEGLGSQAGARFSALLTGFSSGTVYAHLLQLEQVLPCWQDATPQVAYDHRGEVAAVRYEVEAVAPKQPTQGLETVPEEGSSSGAARVTNRLTAAPAAAAAADADLVSPLLLLDALKINLHLEPPANSSGVTGGYSRGDPADSDEESDAGYDPSEQQQHKGGSRSCSGVVRGLIGIGAGSSDSDSDDEEDEQLQQLRKVTLLAAPELPGRFWACHDQGCWGINIKWLQQMNSSDGDVPGAFGSLSGSSDGGWGQQQQRQGGDQQQQLPAPAVQELLVSGPGVNSSCVVGNALFGSGCVVLEKGPGPQLVFLKPRPTGVLGEGVVGTAAAAAEGAGEAAAAAGDGEAGDELGVAELLLTPEELDTRSRQQEYYADITRGPHRLQPPARPDNLGSLSPADPQGLQYSRDVTNWLSETHVRFGVGVSVDLQKRIGELHDLVSDQEQLLGHLKHLAQAAAERQAGLQARIDRLTKAAAALSERGNLLASMHWSLPRPTSKAEQQMSRHLEVWEQQLQQTQKAWKALHSRLDKVVSAAEAQKQQQRQQEQQAAAAAAASPLGVRGLAAARAEGRQVTQKPSGPLTAAQLERVRELLQMQHAAIAADSAELGALSSLLEAWRLEHPEVDLPARLLRLGTVV